ncbi:MAG: peptidylprolyl isomerase [Candidatus Paceibacterota bacterium]|jgi:cyclophilin family peptidyl-prolyl cis-trans isomerase
MSKSAIFTVIITIIILVGIGYSAAKPNTPPDEFYPEAINLSVEGAPSMTPPPISQEQTITNPNQKAMNTVTIETTKGIIVFETYNNDAPKTVENFITLAKKNFYDGIIFHRVIKGFMIQGGDPTGTGSGGPGYKFADELNSNTESYKNGYKKGVVAMANAGPNTNGSQFFIMLADTPLPNNYTIFGKVIKGQDVVDAIGNVKTNSSDRPLEDVKMVKVTIE